MTWLDDLAAPESPTDLDPADLTDADRERIARRHARLVAEHEHKPRGGPRVV